MNFVMLSLARLTFLKRIDIDLKQVFKF